MSTIKFYWDDFKKKDHLTAKLIFDNSHIKSDLSKSENPLILKGFIKDDTNIGMSNSWGQAASIQDKMANVVGFGNSANMQKELSTTIQQIGAEDVVNGWLNTMGEVTGSKDLQSGNLLNSFRKNYSDYAKVYEGSDVTLPNSFEVHFIADKLGVDPRIEAKKCLFNLVGGFSPTEDPTKAEVTKSSTSSHPSGDLYGLIFPPGGFVYNPSVINTSGNLKGTCTLVIGGSTDIKKTLRIKNLLIDRADLVISKYTTIDDYPLYVTLTISLVPAVYFSGNTVSEILGGDGNLVPNNIEVTEVKLDENGQPIKDEKPPVPPENDIPRTPVGVFMDTTKKVIKTAYDLSPLGVAGSIITNTYNLYNGNK